MSEGKSKNILNLPMEYDLWLATVWNNGHHGICGHTFEQIEYYLILKNHMRVGIIFQKNMTWDIIRKAIVDKYNLSTRELNNIEADSIIENSPRMAKGKNILFTDGEFSANTKNTLFFENIIYFSCGDKQIIENNDKKVWVLQDNRVYKVAHTNNINYKKKILFNRFKKIDKSANKGLIYSTTNCREVDWSEYKKIQTKTRIENLVVLSNKKELGEEGIEILEPPVSNMFERFTTYIYTPTEKKWDCSPRFIAECKYYGKEVVYYNIDYLDEDLGLYWRKWDIENDFDSIRLEDDDEIINIVKGIIG